MNKHLNKRQKQCPAGSLDIVLTNEIKEQILQNRIYHVPQPPQQNVHNYVQINNIISNIDVVDKITKYTQYNKIELLTLDQSIEEKFMVKARRLENDDYKFGFELTKDDLFDVIDQVSNAYRVKTFQDLNIYYDSKVNKLKIFDGEWEEMLTNRGIRKIIETIQAYYWDEYECYLLRKIYQCQGFKTQRCIERLEEYYKFIGSFDIEPYCKDKANNIILSLPNEDDHFSISTEWYSKYVKIRDNIKQSDIVSNKKDVLDIIRKNSAKNIDELNKKVFELFSNDLCFKEEIMGTIV